MRVLIVNKSESTGGAAVAARRLMDALNNNGVKARMLVAEKESDSITVSGLSRRWLLRWHFLWERLAIFARLYFNREHLFEVDIANSGNDITGTREFREADVIHLHWINQGMLSLAGIRRILDSGKPVVWTMHDLWPAASICHYARGCGMFKSGCRRCPLLPGGGGDNDLAAKVWRKKQRMLKDRSIYYVACSKWLAGEARNSALLRGQHVTDVPNAIATGVFRPTDRAEARHLLGLPADTRLILFVSQRVTDRRKGMDYFVEAMTRLAAEHPELAAETNVAVLGGHAEDVAPLLPVKVLPLGYVSDEHRIVDIYNAADVFVLPSLEDNLPNTIMEAMACGVPCVGFRVGGIPEMIDHRRNGYVAAYRDSADLAEGINWVLSHDNTDELRRAAVSKVVSHYSEQSVALRYIEVYNQALAQKHYRI